MPSQGLTTHQQTEIFNAFNGTTYVPDCMDVQIGAIWDSVQLERGQEFNSSLALFRHPVGHPAYPLPRLKTLTDTSMVERSRLPAPQAFAVKRVVFTFSRDTVDKDLYAIAERLLWRFWLGQKYYLWSILVSMPAVHQPIAPFRVCSFCAGVYVQSTQCPGCGAKDFTLSSLGDPQLSGRQFALDVYPHVVINNQMSFYMSFECETYRVENKFKMWCHLEGLHAREVQ
jgi:hypothetical protein